MAIFSADIFAGIIVVEGHYQNQNLYVQNGYSASGVGFCTYEVRVNGVVSTDELNVSAFEIDLEAHALLLGEPVTIHIKYKDDGCIPKVLNSNALKPNPTFECTSIHIDKMGVISWTTVNETAKLNFVIEQFKWNKWIQIGISGGTGIPTSNSYTFRTTPHSGINKFRVKQKGYIDKTKYTPSVSYACLKQEVTYIYNKKKQHVDFSKDTGYEVIDKFGNIIKKGFGKRISVSNLKKDLYFLNFGNTSSEFKKK